MPPEDAIVTGSPSQIELLDAEAEAVGPPEDAAKVSTSVPEQAVVRSFTTTLYVPPDNPLKNPADWNVAPPSILNS